MKYLSFLPLIPLDSGQRAQVSARQESARKEGREGG